MAFYFFFVSCTQDLGFRFLEWLLEGYDQLSDRHLTKLTLIRSLWIDVTVQ